jgi:hypothetical protein
MISRERDANHGCLMTMGRGGNEGGRKEQLSANDYFIVYIKTRYCAIWFISKSQKIFFSKGLFVPERYYLNLLKR